ncbi:VanZ family protein [Virgibacillus ndiopensis]|uniref:VanZ family protein n=1 Tax=Virgibacillus ndiopensis TaxID=2004408 RepID=UPI000C07396D|nr:VanZ family protein [Virgibacillus ndiopensis]
MRKYIYWGLPIVWMGVIFYSSAQPYEDQDIKPLLSDTIDLSFLIPLFDWVSFTYHHSEVSVDALGIAGFIEFFVRKGAHFTVFFILACLFIIAIVKSIEINYKRTLFISFLLTVSYAGVDEFHQGFTANRTPYVGDVLLDAFGAATACLLFFWWIIKFGYRTTKTE